MEVFKMKKEEFNKACEIDAQIEHAENYSKILKDYRDRGSNFTITAYNKSRDYQVELYDLNKIDIEEIIKYFDKKAKELRKEFEEL